MRQTPLLLAALAALTATTVSAQPANLGQPTGQTFLDNPLDQSLPHVSDGWNITGLPLSRAKVYQGSGCSGSPYIDVIAPSEGSSCITQTPASAIPGFIVECFNSFNAGAEEDSSSGWYIRWYSDTSCSSKVEASPYTQIVGGNSATSTACQSFTVLGGSYSVSLDCSNGIGLGPAPKQVIVGNSQVASPIFEVPAVNPITGLKNTDGSYHYYANGASSGSTTTTTTTTTSTTAATDAPTPAPTTTATQAASVVESTTAATTTSAPVQAAAFTSTQTTTPAPTDAATTAATSAPTPAPTAAPTPAPTSAPTPAPTAAATPVPTTVQTQAAFVASTPAPTAAATPAPTAAATAAAQATVTTPAPTSAAVVRAISTVAASTSAATPAAASTVYVPPYVPQDSTGTVSDLSNVQPLQAASPSYTTGAYTYNGTDVEPILQGLQQRGTASCPAGNSVCFVYDPLRLEENFAGSQYANPVCYDPSQYVCQQATAFLCPLSAPLSCGRACFDSTAYSCAVDPHVWMHSTLVARPTTSTKTVHRLRRLL